MKALLLRRLLAGVLGLGLLVTLGVSVVFWLLSGDFGRRRVAQAVREALTHNSALVLAPFVVELSPWRDFPHLTASIQGISLTDTAFQQRVPVLRVGRADLRLELYGLLRSRVQITRLVMSNVDFREQTDSLGRSWSLRGKRPKGTGAAPSLRLELDELLIRHFRISSRNAYSHSAFGAEVPEARFTARLRGGVLRVAGTLHGQLSYLRTRSGTLFEREPVWASVHYTYRFEQHEGHLWHTRATLNGDTIRVHGTHTVDPHQPTGTLLNLVFVGNQPLTNVLRAALPPRLETYLEGATSPSKAHIHYTITGLSGPTVSPRNVLTFSLRGARLHWPDPTRRINRWDLQGTYDNGPAHRPQSTVLHLRRCRIYSPAGQLDIALTLRNFTRPFLDGRFRGRTELPELAALVAPGGWQARHGLADLDVALRGLLPTRPGRTRPGPPPKNLSLRGRLTLRNASFWLPGRGADLSALNVRMELQDSIWRLANAAGVLNGMRFQAAATTVHLLDYLTGEHPTASITGNFAVDELHLARLRPLLRPGPHPSRTTPFPIRLRRANRLPKPARTPRDQAQLAATLGRELIPPGLHLDVGLRCQRLPLAADTLRDLAVTVRHNGQQMQLLDLRGRVWNGSIRGNMVWPTDSSNRITPVYYQLALHFTTLNYREFLARLAQPAPRLARPVRASSAALPALRDVILAANGQLTLAIDQVLLPGNEQVSQVSLGLEKTGPVLQMPFLRFRTPEGGQGEASATAQVENLRLLAADADVTLRYPILDVQRLLAIIASLTPPHTDSLPTAQTLARNTRRATRRARRQALPNPSLYANGVLSAVLRVEADEVHYGAIRGSQFRLVSHLLDGQARLDNCTFDAFGGHIGLRGRITSTANRFHHPTQALLQLDAVQLPALFATATTLGFNVLGGNNIRGTLHGVADLRTDLDATFLPKLTQTTGYLKTDFQHLELLDVEALMEALKFLKARRTSHLYFEPVSSEFILHQGQLLIPSLRLNSNLSNLEVSGYYGLDGCSNLFIGLQPFQTLFGNNTKRITRIQNGTPISRPTGKLTYVNLRRTAPGEPYKARFFQKQEQHQEQTRLRQQCRALLITQHLDTTVQLGQ